MTDEIEKNPLQVAYNAALDAVGREAANDICKAHGVADNGLHPWRRVPSSKRKACVAALEAAGGRSRGAEKAAKSFQQVRREAFARIGATEREAPTPPKRLDAESIYARWNNPPPVED